MCCCVTSCSWPRATCWVCGRSSHCVSSGCSSCAAVAPTFLGSTERWATPSFLRCSCWRPSSSLRMRSMRSSGPRSPASSSRSPACPCTSFGWHGSDVRRLLGHHRPPGRAHSMRPSNHSGRGMTRRILLLATVALVASASCLAGGSVPAPPGPVVLTVQLPRPSQQIFDVHEVMPVKPGSLTLYYPKWIPGDHSPDGPIEEMMGLEITAGGKRIAWRRDEVDMFAFHLTVPEGVDRIYVRFQFPASDRITPHLMGLEWNVAALYYAGYPTKAETFQPTLVIPAGWGYASALKTERRSGGTITFKPVPFNTLVDSPVIAGEYFREIDVTPPASPVHRYLDMVGDSAAAIAISDAQVA